MRPIDADALIEGMMDELYDRSDYWYKMIVDVLVVYINNMPTIDIDQQIQCYDDYDKLDLIKKIVSDMLIDPEVTVPEPAGYCDDHLDQIVDDMLQ